MVAARLDTPPLIDWVDGELVGYATDAETPMRALLASAHGDDARYRDYRDRYRAMATSPGLRGSHELGRGDAMTAGDPES